MEISEHFIPKELEPHEVVILCGAGISMNPPTSLPTVYKFFETIIRHCCTDTTEATNLIDKIKNHSNNYSKTISPRFEVLIEQVKNAFDENLEVASIFSSDTFNEIHLFIAELLSKGASLITTNFDCCIENACNANKIGYNKYTFTGQSSDLPSTPIFEQVIVKIHGSIEQSQRNSLVMTLSALSKTKNGFLGYSEWRSYLLELLKNKTVLVLGYSGSDDFDITPIMKEAQFNDCYWYNFNYNKDIPEQISINQTGLNDEFKSITKINAIDCNIGAFLQNHYLFTYSKDKKKPVSSLTIDQYLSNKFPSEFQKNELLNTLLFHYNLHEEILKLNKNPVSDLSFLQKIQSLYRLGNHEEICKMVEKNKFDLALTKFSKKYRTELLHNYASALYYLGNIKKAIEQAKKMRSIAKRSKDLVSEMNALTFLGATNFLNWKHKSAQYFYTKVLELNKTYPYLDCEIKAKWGLGDIEFRRKDFDKTLDYYEEALKGYSDMGNLYGIANAEHNIGMVLYVTKDYINSIKHLQESVKIFTGFLIDKNEVSHDLLYCYYNLAKSFYRAGQKKDAYIEIIKAVNKIEGYQGHPHYHEIICLTYFLLFDANGIKALKNEIRNKKFDILINKPNAEIEQGFESFRAIDLLYNAQNDNEIVNAMNLAFTFFNSD